MNATIEIPVWLPTLLVVSGLLAGAAIMLFFDRQTLADVVSGHRQLAVNDQASARWLFLRGYRKTPHAGPDLTPEPEPEPLALSDRSHADEQADHTDTDRAGMWRVLVGLASDLVDRVHDWLPNLLRQRAERNQVGSGEQATDRDPFAELLAHVEAAPEPEPVRIVRVNRYRDPGMTGQFPYVKVAGAPRHAAPEPEPEMSAINAAIPVQRTGGDDRG